MGFLFAYAKLENNVTTEYPIWEGDLAVRLNVEGSDAVAAAAAQNGYVRVMHIDDQPSVDYTQDVIEGSPTNNNGVWVRTFIVQAASAEEVAKRTEACARFVREDRNRRLSECDWTQLADAPLTDAQKTAWAAYRQELRDVPSQSGFPWNVIWPTKPE